MLRLRLLIACALLALCAAPSAGARKHSSDPTLPTKPHKQHSRGKGTVGQFDYYIMALSWSPTFCQTHPDQDEQCNHKGYGFVLHGLWPQYEGGGGPELCENEEDNPDRKTVARALAFMPSKSLVLHEWRSHGVCTGLEAGAYFDLADRAFAAVQIPPELKAPRSDVQIGSDALRAAFRRANPKLTDDMLTLHCSRGDLVEVRVCLDKNAAPRACGRRLRNACPASAPFTLPAAN